MSTSDPKAKIVRPLGIIGGDYEVDEAGVWKVRASWLVAILVIAFVALRAPLEVDGWLVAVVGMAISLALSVDVARKGRKVS